MSLQQTRQKLKDLLENYPDDEFLEVFNMHIQVEKPQPPLLIIFDLGFAGWELENLNNRIIEIFGDNIPSKWIYE